MNEAAKYGIGAVAAVTIGLTAFWIWGGTKQRDYSTCGNIIPASGSSYGLYLTDSSGGPEIATGSVHFYPGGFKHNVAILFQPISSSPDQSPATYDLGATCKDYGSGANATATMALIDTKSGQQVSTLVFNYSPIAGSNATFGLTLSQYNSSNIPPKDMVGDAYLMK